MLSQDTLLEIEQAAVDLARTAGAEIAAAVNRTLTVSYKTDAEGQAAPTDPVSEVDHRVEVLIRDELVKRFPTHGVIGEEIDPQSNTDQDFVWVVDPVDGTTNFVNGFPLFAASIGALYKGYPIVGAIWCSTSHELRPGIYHAHHGGGLFFDGNIVEPKSRSQVKRRLAGDPGGSGKRTPWWDNRVTGSAAIECAFVAAGLLIAARLNDPGIWDVGAGLALIGAAGGAAWTQEGERWVPMERFIPPAAVTAHRQPTLRDWNQPLIIGMPEATRILRNAAS